MIEIYMFVNPLDTICFETEQNLITYFDENNIKATIRIIPVVRLATLKKLKQLPHYLKKAGLTYHECYNLSCELALDFRAIQLHGTNRALTYLKRMQHAIIVEKKTYSPELIKKVLAEINFNLKTFNNERATDIVTNSLLQDLALARELGVYNLPATVIFDFRQNSDYGMIINSIDFSDLASCLQAKAPENHNLKNWY